MEELKKVVQQIVDLLAKFADLAEQTEKIKQALIEATSNLTNASMIAEQIHQGLLANGSLAINKLDVQQKNPPMQQE